MYSRGALLFIYLDDNRIDFARRFGATATINPADSNAVEAVMKLPAGSGGDTAIEAVGILAPLELFDGIVGAGGTFANIGVHRGSPARRGPPGPHQRITTRFADAATIPMQLRKVAAKKIDPTLRISHRVTLAEGAAGRCGGDAGFRPR